MKFSVIIPATRGRAAIHRVLKSIDDTEFEGELDVIVVNNNPLHWNAYKNKLADFEKIRPRFFNEKRSGPSFARNCGIRRANHPYLIFIDDDCVVPKNFFANYQLKWQKYPQAKILGGKVIATVENGSLSAIQKKMVKKYPWSFGNIDLGDHDKEITEGHLLLTANLGYRLNAGEKLRFNEKLGVKLSDEIIVFGEDYELCCRTLLSKEKVIYSPDLYVYNLVDQTRFTREYIYKRFIIAGLEMRLMEKILFASFPNHQILYSKQVKNALKQIITLERIRGNLFYFTSIPNILLLLSYYLAKFLVN